MEKPDTGVAIADPETSAALSVTAPDNVITWPTKADAENAERAGRQVPRDEGDSKPEEVPLVTEITLTYTRVISSTPYEEEIVVESFTANILPRLSPRLHAKVSAILRESNRAKAQIQKAAKAAMQMAFMKGKDKEAEAKRDQFFVDNLEEIVDAGDMTAAQSEIDRETNMQVIPLILDLAGLGAGERAMIALPPDSDFWEDQPDYEAIAAAVKSFRSHRIHI